MPPKGLPVPPKNLVPVRRIRKDGYVMYGNRLEHRVVMEGVLGRPLKRTERVHHKNTNRSDNHPKNLELWVTGQPTGGRVGDLVAWARDILDQYGHLA